MLSSPGRTNACAPGRVAVLDLAGEEPRDRLQAGVRVAGHDHAAGLRHVVGSVVVDEAPRADQRALPLRKAAADRHGARTAERHLPVGQHDGGGRARAVGAADDLGGVPLWIAHSIRLGRARGSALADQVGTFAA